MPHTPPKALFSRWPLSNFIGEKRRLAEEEVHQLAPEHFQNMTLAQLAEDLYARHEIPPIALQEASLKPPEEEEFEAADYQIKRKKRAFLYTLAVPFTGNPDLLWCTPPATDNHPPTFHVNPAELTHPFLNRDGLSKESVDSHFKLELARLSGWLALPNQAANNFNRMLKTQLPRWLDSRKNKLEANSLFMADLSFPLQKIPAPEPVALPFQRKELTLTVPPSNRGSEREHVLEEAHYHDILQSLSLMSTVMERSPHAFAKIDEESLRFFFLVWLNANYRGGATAETFNFTGKTDILITIDGKIVFIGECKFWKGPASLRAAIDQILSYASWRDTKTAILLFNRKGKFSTILSKIAATVQQHPAFVKDLDLTKATEKSFLLKNPKDNSRKLTLTVLAFDIPKEI